MANVTKIYEIKLTGQKNLVSDMQVVNKSFDEAKKRFSELKSQFKNGLNSPEMSVIKLQIEQTRLEMLKLKKEQIELTNEGKAYNNALKVQREEERKANQQKKLSLTEYQKLSKELTNLRNFAKEVAVVFGEESKEFKQAAAEANKLDVQLKKIDSSLGQFQRNVGNYPKNINIGGISQNTFNQLKSSGLGDILGNQVDSVKAKVRALDSEFLILKNRITQARSSGVTDLNALEKEIIQNRIEADRMNQEISQSTIHLNGLGSVGTGVFGRLNTDVKQLILGYVGLHAAISMVSQTVHGMRELSDQTTNLEIELEKTARGADHLVDKLAEIDTRTKLVELENIINIAARAGVAEDQLVGVTEAIDKIKVSFGKDFGEVEQGTEGLIKLINIFEGEGNVTEDNLMRMGNAVRTLANESVATVPYLNDFSKRMAGLKGISEVTLPSVLGLASGFEQFGQSAETSSTALVRIIPQLAKDTEKFGKIAGMTKKEFSELINSNPVEALIKVAEGIAKNKNGIEDLIQALGDSDLAKKGGVGITNALGTLGKNADAFRNSIESANKSYQDTSNITDAFNKKNQNFAAVLDKISKKFADLGNNKSFQKLLIILSSLVLGLITTVLNIPFGWWVAGITLLTLAYWENVAALIANISQQAVYIARMTAGNALLVTARIITIAHTVVVVALNLAYKTLNATMLIFGTIIPGIRTAWLFLNSAMLATPLGWILAGLTAVGAATYALGQKTDKTAKSIREKGKIVKQTAEQLKLYNEIEKQVNETTTDTVSKMETLTKVVKDNKLSLDARKEALRQLIDISPKYLKGLTLENIATQEGTDILEKYKNKILEVARAKAEEQLLSDKLKEKRDIELSLPDLAAKKQIREETYNKISLQSFIQDLKQTGKDLGLSEGDDIDIYNAKIKKVKELDKEIKILQKDVVENKKEEIKDSLTDKGGNDDDPEKTKKYFGSRLGGYQKDFLKDVDAIRDKLLADNEKAYTKGEISEKEYLQNILSINTDAWTKKLGYIKGSNAEERKQRAVWQLEQVKLEKGTQEKLFDIDSKALKKRYDLDKGKLDNDLRTVTENPLSNNLEKVEAQQLYYEQLLQLTTDFNFSMDGLEKKYNQNIIESANIRASQLLEIERQMNNTSYKLTEERFNKQKKLINNSVDKVINEKNINAELAKQNVLRNDNLTTRQKENEIARITAINELEQTEAELYRVQTLIKEYIIKQQTDKITVDQQIELNELLGKEAELITDATKRRKEQNKIGFGSGKINAPSDSNTQELIKEQILKSLNLDEDAFGSMVGTVISQSWDLASTAMNNYFDAERNRIEQSKQLAYERIDLEKEQLLAQAQSQAERDSLEKQAEEKKKQADKVAGEQLKKSKKAELQITLATELANIATSAASNPLNGVTFGAAGAAMYTVMSALAFARYAINLSNVNKTQFKRGGILKGPSHSQGGMPVINPVTGEKQAEMEGEEGIVNQKSMKDKNVYSVTGTPSQIVSRINAMGGGVDWAGGASIKKFLKGGTYLGSHVQPPVFRSYYDKTVQRESENYNSERLDRLEASVLQTAENLDKETKKKVVVSSREITDVQRENKKQSEIATL